jgi:hypothetical protein
MANATNVSVTFYLDSSAGSPPYNVSSTMQCVVTYDDGGQVSFPNFATEAIGTLANNGAAFTLIVVDRNYSNSATTVGNWALTCIPRNSATGVSPFQAQNSPTITNPGNGVSSTNANGTFTLSTGNARLKNSGTWDWSLMVQMIMSDNTTIKCFASDPEMDIS